VWPRLLPALGAMLLLGAVFLAAVVKKTRKRLEP
jgi:hypothetical protein